MAKEAGIGWSTCSVDDSGTTLRAMVGDVTSLDIGVARGTQDVAGLNRSAQERLLLLSDFTVALSGVYNDAATTGAHTVLSTITTSRVARTVTLVVSGNTHTNEVLFDSYQVTRAADGSLTWTATGSLSSGTPPAWT